MNSNNSNAQSGNIGFCGVLFLIFLVLKLCNIINWSWWWVTAPLWIPIALVIVIIVGITTIKAIIN